MNILTISPIHNQIFTSKSHKKDIAPITEIPFDIVSFNSKGEGNPPDKIIFTPLEEEYNKVLWELQKLESNIKVQKQNLRDYYSAQDKYDYQELLNERKKIKAQLRRIFKKTGGQNQIAFEISILEKRQYNYYAKKILKAKTLDELNQFISSIRPSILFLEVEKLLNKLISTRIFK